MKRKKRYPVRYDKNPVVIFNPDIIDVIAEEIRKNERKQKERTKEEKEQGEDEKDSETE